MRSRQSSIVRLEARLEAVIGARTIDVALDTGPGTLVLVGPNGAGKTSVLSLLLGRLPATRGRIAIGGTVLLDTDARVLVPTEQRRLGYVPQDYGLFPHLSVAANIGFALASAYPRLGRRARAARVEAALERLDLRSLAERAPARLSGGERQRVALARALSVEPRALLLDEPMAALDVHARREVVAALAASLRELALPSLVVTHDPHEARLLGHTIAVLEAGRIVQHGTWDELARAPRTPFVERFVAAAGPAHGPAPLHAPPHDA